MRLSLATETGVPTESWRHTVVTIHRTTAAHQIGQTAEPTGSFGPGGALYAALKLLGFHFRPDGTEIAIGVLHEAVEETLGTEAGEQLGEEEDAGALEADAAERGQTQEELGEAGHVLRVHLMAVLLQAGVELLAARLHPVGVG